MTTAQAPSGPYADWIAWIDSFAQGPAAPAEHLSSTTDPRLAGHVAERIVERYAEAFGVRTNAWVESLMRDVNSVARSGRGSYGPVLLDARRRLNRLCADADAPPIPDVIREQVREELDKLAVRAQEQLETAARSGGPSSRLLAEIRGTPLTTRPL